jgi:hypothetical protein
MVCTTHHKQEDEDAEHLILKALHGVFAVEERETDQHRAADGKDSLGVDV